jgi:hypothetical protein
MVQWRRALAEVIEILTLAVAVVATGAAPAVLVAAASGRLRILVGWLCLHAGS